MNEEKPMPIKTPKNTYIAEARSRLGMVQKQLAPLIGTSEDTLSHYETGRRQPSKYVLDKVRRLLIDRGLANEPCSPVEEKLLEEFRLLPQSDQERFSGILHSLTETYRKKPKRKSTPG
ncbi:MAG: helix-turn-helix transcriptional regulator [Chitinispirillia bacterium]|nr:helix-turn-helix transcriptional regulator [Chitinispirillia bacterium]MCL2268078.1 helix-turn-helix transcriptional regulator [Chitinispirillia bacterium]